MINLLKKNNWKYTIAALISAQITRKLNFLFFKSENIPINAKVKYASVRNWYCLNEINVPGLSPVSTKLDATGSMTVEIAGQNLPM